MTRRPSAAAATAAPAAIAAAADLAAATPVAATGPFAEQLAAYDRVALLLQGGGALGAYHVGVWEALEDAAIEPTWISGVSIGAINAAIIAGNPPETRREKLEAFWATITRDPGIDLLGPWSAFHPFRALQNQWSALGAMALGRPGFFAPRSINPWLLPAGTDGSDSFYDTAPLAKTLAGLIDFDRLNDGPMRFSVGAVDVENGNFVWFDTREPGPDGKRRRLDLRHVMASGALPPALPAVEIDGRHYWDGGIVSNTPLEHLLDQDGDVSSLVFQVDLFPAEGKRPRSMAEVMARQKDITYSSRTRAGTTRFAQKYGLQRQLLAALERIPADLRTAEERALLDDLRQPGVVNILQLVYRTRNWESDNKDYEFSARSARDHRAAGRRDAGALLARREWLVPPDAAAGVVVRDLHRDGRR
ncbi:patatin-like phospholipase family protein [Siculibacillus lacustris]|uniref:Patatin-like phospholipase family protein n=1 Tax=Siculibacillus lacustris TaxID=1549641 RepID=A0A4Q9VYV6_9HYPH|nr:patatin-like phospholipase family protein [Siculibacillus lacustris]TBW40711.1 patatin-like phospholipase family protein [Siculibacillus lacustris]